MANLTIKAFECEYVLDRCSDSYSSIQPRIAALLQSKNPHNTASPLLLQLSLFSLFSRFVLVFFLRRSPRHPSPRPLDSYSPITTSRLIFELQPAGNNRLIIQFINMLPNVDRTKSYWIEAAQSNLKDFRSTHFLPSETDVVIVGSGYSGTTAAYWLHKV